MKSHTATDGSVGEPFTEFLSMAITHVGMAMFAAWMWSVCDGMLVEAGLIPARIEQAFRFWPATAFFLIVEYCVQQLMSISKAGRRA